MCDSRAAADIGGLSPTERWNQMDCDSAWRDVIAVWKDSHKNKTTFTFTQSISLTLHGPPHARCESLMAKSNCGQSMQCDGF